MATIFFGDFAPDTFQLDDQADAPDLLNVIPRGDGFGPIRGLAEWTTALPSRCRGLFYARTSNGSVAIFAGTSTRLYQLNNTTLAWIDVSKGGSSYTVLNADESWQFVQFNNFVIAVQANTAPQVFDLTSSTAFADLGGSPPQARYIAIVNRFVVLFGLASNPFRVQWSGLNAVTTWTSGVNSSDYQDLPDGGIARGVSGGDLGYILQDSAIRRMTFSPGSDVVFQIDRVGRDIGVLAPQSIINVNSKLFFISSKGFMRMDAGSSEPAPIGEARVNEFFASSYDSAGIGFVQSAADPNSNTCIWTFRTSGSSADGWDAMLIYNYIRDRWSYAEISGQYIGSIAKPGLTLEALDAIAPGAQSISNAVNNGVGRIRLTVPSTSGWATGDYKTISLVVGTTEANGTWPITVINATTIDLQGSTFTNAYVSGGVVGGSLDLLLFSLDSAQAASLANLAIAGPSNKVGYLNGNTLEATLETGEQSTDNKRILVRGFYVISDAPTVYGSISKREQLSDDLTYTNETLKNARGFVPQLRSTRYARGKIRIPAGTAWTFASGIRPDVTLDGEI